MSLVHAVVLFGAAAVAGALNSFAGGGSFISFPSLVFLGVPIISANVTNKIALWPGAMSGAVAYRRELATVSSTLLVLISVSLLGSMLGAVLLLRIDPEMFERMVPYLLLTATLLFMFSDKMKAWSQSHRQRTPSPETHQADRDGWRTIATMALLQFIIAIYGGFFGGGMGIMMLAMLAVTGMEHMHTMNALKNLLGSFITGISVLTFVVEDVLTRMQGMEGVIAWPQAIVMIVGASVGGYLGGSFSRTWDPLLVRRAVIVAGFVMTIIFFVRQ